MPPLAAQTVLSRRGHGPREAKGRQGKGAPEGLVTEPTPVTGDPPAGTAGQRWAPGGTPPVPQGPPAGSTHRQPPC